jgi:hypothetical protein
VNAAVRVLKALVVSLILGGASYGMAKLNLFGLSDASDRAADNIYQRVTAADYGKDRRGQAHTGLIYLDEASVESMKGFGWNRFPPTFEQQWMMLDDLLNVGGAPPAAMFVDFVYMGQGGNSEGFDRFVQGVGAATRAEQWRDKPACLADPLTKIACIVQAGGVPIIFAKPSPGELDFFTDAQKALDGVSILAPALVQTHAYPTVIDYGFDAAKAARLGVHRFDISPALAVYVAWCLRRADACQDVHIGRLREAGRAAMAGRAAPRSDLPQVFEEPLDVVWGSRADPAFRPMVTRVSGAPPACRAAGGGWRDRLFEQWAGLRGPGEGDKQECPYTLGLGYDRLVGGVGLELSDLERLLANKIVFVGGHFRASNDWVDSPVHGQLPGVHLHAMAADNLLEYGADYRRNGAALLDSDILESALLSALAFCGVLGVMWRNSLLDRAIEDGMEPRLRATAYGPLYVLIFSSSLIVVFVVTWAGATVANRSPINWVGISGVALGFLFYATRQTLPADLCGSLEKLPWIRRALAYGRLCRRAMRFEEDRLVTPRRRPPPAPTPIPATAESPKDTPAHVKA